MHSGVAVLAVLARVVQHDSCAVANPPLGRWDTPPQQMIIFFLPFSSTFMILQVSMQQVWECLIIVIIIIIIILLINS